MEYEFDVYLFAFVTFGQTIFYEKTLISKLITKHCCEILSLFFADTKNPISHELQAAEFPPVDESSVGTLISFVFQEYVARKALKISVRFFSGKTPSKGWLKYYACLLCEKHSFVSLTACKCFPPLGVSFVFGPLHLIELNFDCCRSPEISELFIYCAELII